MFFLVLLLAKSTQLRRLATSRPHEEKSDEGLFCKGQLPTAKLNNIC